MAGSRDDENRDYSGASHYQDYQDQWRLLEQQHQRRLAMARSEADTESEAQSSSSPFASFKRFVDSNFNTLSESFKNFPSNVSELRSRMQREQERRQEEEQDISEAWTGSSDSPDHVQMEVLRSSRAEKDEAHAATLMLLTEAFRRNADVPAEKIAALYEDRESTLGELDRLVNPMLALGGAWFYMPETGDRLPVGRDKWQWMAPSPRWLSVEWFKRSPYSPIRLEKHPDLGPEGSKWRAAFEDLMDAALDKPMASFEQVGIREPHGRPQSTYWGPGLEWMLSLQCRGILPPLLPRFFNDPRGKLTLRAAPHHILSQVQRDLPWSSEHALNWHSALNRDFSELMSEVAIKSTAEWEAEPFPLTAQPETEQDLYDSEHLCPPAVSRAFGSPRYQPSKEEDWAEADVALWEAIDNKSPAAAAQIISRWHKEHGDVMELVINSLTALSQTWSSEPHNGSFSVLTEAIRRSDIPDHHYLKQRAFSPEFEAMEEADQAGEEERAYRQRLMERGDELAGRYLPWSLCSTRELERKIVGMEQEYGNLLEMTGETKQAPTTSDAASTKKPDVLSALTTTQTTRLPDGTVTTTVVLKKRFADGREETTESVHTTNENVTEQHQAAAEHQQKKKGWFWS
ncbi:Hypothetical predicted protein [Lecanosticta acicola]|uniref:Uncharacterized protein n=1 Tax=Lecanosticta acicola TaxID=111012 RepID=A0AAI8Z5W0_9PEZI|nr:Hypothetical predicted protein [Lecanosticta acicola]